jgi:hypothetical protein
MAHVWPFANSYAPQDSAGGDGLIHRTIKLRLQNLESKRRKPRVEVCGSHPFHDETVERMGHPTLWEG